MTQQAPPPVPPRKAKRPRRTTTLAMRLIDTAKGLTDDLNVIARIDAARGFLALGDLLVGSSSPAVAVELTGIMHEMATLAASPSGRNPAQLMEMLQRTIARVIAAMDADKPASQATATAGQTCGPAYGRTPSPSPSQGAGAYPSPSHGAGPYPGMAPDGYMPMPAPRTAGPFVVLPGGSMNGDPDSGSEVFLSSPPRSGRSEDGTEHFVIFPFQGLGRTTEVSMLGTSGMVFRLSGICRLDGSEERVPYKLVTDIGPRSPMAPTVDTASVRFEWMPDDALRVSWRVLAPVEEPVPIGEVPVVSSDPEHGPN